MNLAPDLKPEQAARVALALQAKELQFQLQAKELQAKELQAKELQAKELQFQLQLQAKEFQLQLQAKESDNQRRMGDLTPLYNRQALEQLVQYLGDKHRCTKRHKNGTVAVGPTIAALKVILAECENTKALRGADTVYRTLSEKLHALPLPHTIEMSAWNGLDGNEKAFMEYVFKKIKSNGLDNPTK
jgi:hypothetical protein